MAYTAAVFLLQDFLEKSRNIIYYINSPRGSNMWKILNIFDGDYGYEELKDGETPRINAKHALY